MVAEERLDVQVKVLAILPHRCAFEAVGFGLRDPGLACNGDRRTAMRRCVDPLLDLDDRVRQPRVGLLSRREGLRAPPLVAVGSRCEIVGDPSDALTGFGLPNALAYLCHCMPFPRVRKSGVRKSTQ